MLDQNALIELSFNLTETVMFIADEEKLSPKRTKKCNAKTLTVKFCQPSFF